MHGEVGLRRPGRSLTQLTLCNGSARLCHKHTKEKIRYETEVERGRTREPAEMVWCPEATRICGQDRRLRDKERLMRCCAGARQEDAARTDGVSAQASAHRK